MSSLWTNRAGKNFGLRGPATCSPASASVPLPLRQPTDEASLDYAYAEVLAGSGGKFTDFVERDVGLRRRDNAGF